MSDLSLRPGHTLIALVQSVQAMRLAVDALNAQITEIGESHYPCEDDPNHPVDGWEPCTLCQSTEVFQNVRDRLAAALETAVREVKRHG